MRFVWLIFVGLIAAMALVLPRLNRPAPAPAAVPNSSFVALRSASPPAGPSARADSIVAFGLAQRGTPYVYAGTSPLTGFDCSGFIMYTFAHFNVAVPHSTALLIDVGRPVARADAQPGDIVVFTGTASTSTTPGHAGIVVSERGAVPLEFVHASSARRESGVKVSHVEGTDYERRFMQVRRVLGAGPVAAARPKPAAKISTAAPVAALPARPVKVAAAIPVAALPSVLAPRKKAAPTLAKKIAKKAPIKKATHAAVAKKKDPTARRKAAVPAKAAAPRKRAAR